MPEKARIHLIIHGQVQGVFFRTRGKEKALELGLLGWIKNNSDGTVELVAEGEKQALKEFIAWCGQGTSSARVEKVETQWQDFKGEFACFRIK